MTTTAHEDQFTAEPEHVTHRPYDTTAILRRNVADLELALKQQTERAEAAEAELLAVREDNHSMMLEIDGLRKELARLREQVPVAMISKNDAGQISIKNPDGSFFDISKNVGRQFYAAHAPAVADLEIALRKQTERAEKAEAELARLREQEPVAYVKYKATGGNVGLSWLAVPTGAFYPHDGEKLYASPVPAPAVPEDWREAMQEAYDTFQRYADLHQAKVTHDGYKKAKANQKLANKLYALLQSASK